MTDIDSKQDGDDGGAVQLHRGAHAHLQTREDDRGHPRELGHDQPLAFQSIDHSDIQSVNPGEQAALPDHLHAPLGGSLACDLH